jgi:hypothetical protein
MVFSISPFRFHILHGVPLPLTDRFHASIWVPVIPQNIYIYIFFFASETRSSKQKGVFHFSLLILLRSPSKRQHVDSFCAELFLVTVPCPVGLAVWSRQWSPSV